MIIYFLKYTVMKKLIHAIILFSLLFFFSCSDDNNNEGIGPNKTYKVRYEASCHNPNVMLRVLYNTKNTDMQNVENDAKEVFVKPPFSVELEMKYGEYCYISVQAEADEETGLISDNIIFTSSIYVNNVKKKEVSNKIVSISDYLLID